MSEATKKLEAAEASLKTLEKHRHAFENTRVDFIKAQQDGDPKKIAAAAATHEAAKKARAEAAVSEEDIHNAAQAVLDARAEVEAEGK